ncbi:MAG: alcohol dehydrogenase catalytic domain-containing protein [Pacificimonas sp.]
MTSMQQLTFIKPGTFEWQEVAVPKLMGAGEALVRPLAVTRCDLDLYIATGVFPMAGPFAFGHEIAGEVVDIGDAVTSVRPGDRAIVPFQINCGTCKPCRAGLTNACTTVPAYSAYGLAPSSGREWGGGLSDLTHVPYADAMLVKIPVDVSLESAAALSDNATDGFRTVADPLRRAPGADVLILGGLAQSVGLYAVQAARALGAGQVVYRDFDADRLATAKAMGADVIETVYDENMPVDTMYPIVVEAAGLPGALAFALRSTAPCGICTGVSAGTAAVAEIPLRSMYMKGATYTVSRVHARADLPAAMECARCRGAPPDDMISRRVSFVDAADAMTDPTRKLVFVRD